MKSKKGLLKKSRLYIIVDKKACGRRSIIDAANKIKNKGYDIIQLRDKLSGKASVLKSALSLRELLLNTKNIFIINDFLDIAKIVDSDGIHLGQDDLSIETARIILGTDKIIGISCHNLKQALDAQNKGANYISIGPIFKTPTKPKISKTLGLDIIKEIKKKIRIPFFVIGGINLKNINQVLSKGAKRVAVCSAICQAKNISSAVKRLSEAIPHL